MALFSGRPLVLATLGLIGMSAVGHASVIMNVQSVSDPAGSTGDTVEVTLTNTGITFDIGEFSFGLSVGTSNLSFTGVSIGTTTAPYVFLGQSLFGPNIAVQPPILPGQMIEAQDFGAFGGVINTGSTVGLGHITFNLAPGTPPGGIPITFIAADDSLFDPILNPIAFSTGSGTITVTPEPATYTLVGVAFALCAILRLYKAPQGGEKGELWSIKAPARAAPSGPAADPRGR